MAAGRDARTEAARFSKSFFKIAAAQANHLIGLAHAAHGFPGGTDAEFRGGSLIEHHRDRQRAEVYIAARSAFTARGGTEEIDGW